MAVVFDAMSGAQGFANSRTWAHNNTGNPNTILLVGGTTNNYATGAPTSCSYAGLPMTLRANRGNFNVIRSAWYYIINPPAGINNVVMTFAGNGSLSCRAVTYAGVGISNPFRLINSARAEADAGNPTVDVNCQVGDVVVDFVGIRRGSYTPVQGAGQTARGINTSGAGDNMAAGISEEAGAAVVTMSWNNPTASWTLIADALVPFVGLRGRAIKYYYDLWDPKPSIKDIQGKVVPPDQLRADAWIEMQGAILPQSEIYDTFVEDPSKARVVEVAAKLDDATLKASRSQFADVLIKRAAAGRG